MYEACLSHANLVVELAVSCSLSDGCFFSFLQEDFWVVLVAARRSEGWAPLALIRLQVIVVVLFARNTLRLILIGLRARHARLALVGTATADHSKRALLARVCPTHDSTLDRDPSDFYFCSRVNMVVQSHVLVLRFGVACYWLDINARLSGKLDQVVSLL